MPNKFGEYCRKQEVEKQKKKKDKRKADFTEENQQHLQLAGLLSLQHFYFLFFRVSRRTTSTSSYIKVGKAEKLLYYCEVHKTEKC